MKILTFNPDDYSDDNNKFKEEMQSYNRVRDSLRKFEIDCNLNLFKLLFNKDGERLWDHFTKDCNRNLTKFLTYLTNDQHTTLLINAHKNKTMYYP